MNLKGIVEILPLLEPPQSFLIPEDLRQKLNPMPSFQEIIIRRDNEDVTDKVEKWLENVLESEKIPDLKSKLDRVKVGDRLCNLTLSNSLLQPNNKEFTSEAISSALLKELSVFISPFVVKKLESLGRGSVFLQSETELGQWIKSTCSPGETLNRQWVINYCSQKSLKKSSNPFFEVQDREQIMKMVSEYNQKTHMVLLLKAGAHRGSFLLPIFPHFDACKKCGAVSR